MKKFLNAVFFSLPLLAAAGTGIAVAATGYPQEIATAHAAGSLVHQAGYFLPNGQYVPTLVCQSQIVGYNIYGQPIFQNFCQYQ